MEHIARVLEIGIVDTVDSTKTDPAKGHQNLLCLLISAFWRPQDNWSEVKGVLI